jgi:hypothetical protein
MRDKGLQQPTRGCAPVEGDIGKDGRPSRLVNLRTAKGTVERPCRPCSDAHTAGTARLKLVAAPCYRIGVGDMAVRV